MFLGRTGAKVGEGRQAGVRLHRKDRGGRQSQKREGGRQRGAGEGGGQGAALAPRVLGLRGPVLSTLSTALCASRRALVLTPLNTGGS